MSGADFKDLLDRGREQTDIVQIIGQRITSDGRQRILWTRWVRAALGSWNRYVPN
jgi:hypothetical protein